MLGKRANKADDKLQEVLNRLKVEKLRCLDTETSGLDWKTNAIVGYVLSFSGKPTDSYYIPFRHYGTANVGNQPGLTTATNWDGKLAKGEKELVTALDQQGTTIFGHNLAFDLKFMHRVGYRMWPRHEDTIINAPLLDEWQGKYSLEFCAQVYKVQAKKTKAIVDYLCSKFPEAAKDDKRAMGHFWRLAGDDPMAVEYAEGDGTTTWQLRDKQMVEIRKTDMHRGQTVESRERVWDVECRLIPVLTRMSILGIKIDDYLFGELRKTIKSTINELLDQFPKDFNPRSNVDVRNWMEQHGETNWPMTPPSKLHPNGQPSFTQGWLEGSEAGRKIVKVRKFTTLRDTFALPLQTTHMFMGRVHTNYNQMKNDEYGTVTGRLSSDSPNLQAVPKHDEEIGRLFRTIFVPDKGKIWGSVDYSQMEPRLLAMYSGCRVLIDGYNADPPLDAHTAVAEAANRNWHNMNESERKYYRNQYAKRINQTIITGGGKNVLVHKYKLPADQVDTVWDDYFKAMPEIKTIQNKMTRVAKERGYITTLLGRRCHIDPDKGYVALNRALQGGNADVLKLKLVEVDDYLESEGRPLDLLNNCHDAVDFQFDEGARKHFNECLRIMQDFGPDQVIHIKRVPITLDIGEGPNWSIATYGPIKPSAEKAAKIAEVRQTDVYDQQRRHSRAGVQTYGKKELKKATKRAEA